MGQGVIGGVQVCTSTPVAKPGEIVLAPTKGGTGEKSERRRAHTESSREWKICGGQTLGWKTRGKDGNLDDIKHKEAEGIAGNDRE